MHRIYLGFFFFTSLFASFCYVFFLQFLSLTLITQLFLSWIHGTISNSYSFPPPIEHSLYLQLSLLLQQLLFIVVYSNFLSHFCAFVAVCNVFSNIFVCALSVFLHAQHLIALILSFMLSPSELLSSKFVLLPLFYTCIHFKCSLYLDDIFCCSLPEYSLYIEPCLFLTVSFRFIVSCNFFMENILFNSYKCSYHSDLHYTVMIVHSNGLNIVVVVVSISVVIVSCVFSLTGVHLCSKS